MHVDGKYRFFVCFVITSPLLPSFFFQKTTKTTTLETINQAKKDLTEIDEKLSLSEKLIRGMGSLFGAFKNMFVRKRRDEREDNVENSSDVFGSQQVQKLLQDGESFVSFDTENVPEVIVQSIAPILFFSF